ncbi:two-component system sensor histidine kinase NtrB [Gaopeijia maritima]|uniref:histidine kinase n=2 Tax=Gaopeijia maritima TaxID=3119007 RepID=A0ABU9EED0_9BACT
MDSRPRSSLLDPREVLRWVFLGRLTLLAAIVIGAIVGSAGTSDGSAVLVATVTLGIALVFTAGSWFWLQRGARAPRRRFLAAQVVVDVVAVTIVVHLTGGPTSDFAPVYILVIAEAALLLPLPGGVFAGVLSSLLFGVDAILVQQGDVDGALALQIALFTAVAVAIGILGDRLRRTGLRLGAVESALEQLRLDTSVILDTLATGVLTVDDRGYLMYLNPAGARLLGVEEGAWQGGQAVMARLDVIAPGFGGVLRRSVEEGVPERRFKTHVERDGRRFTLGVSTTVMDRGLEGPHSATALFQDITDQEALTLLTRRADRLGAVAELSASLAHEIKNPLASIRSAVEQLGRGVREPGDREVLERLVLNESDRLSRLLSEFLDFSGLRMTRQEPVDFGQLVGRVADVVRQHPDARDRGVEVTCERPEGRAVLPGDEDLLHRAVFNLVLNAVQFSGDAGRVEIELRRVPGREVPGPPDASSAWRLRVRDSGPGISPDDAQRIFDPFFTTRHGGNGLGLAVVHRAVEAHEGAVLVGDAPSGGAEFTLFLPAEDRE